MIFLDQLLKKAKVQGPNLTSYVFQTKWKGSDFWLTAQIAPQQGQSGVGGLVGLSITQSGRSFRLVGRAVSDRLHESRHCCRLHHQGYRRFRCCLRHYQYQKSNYCGM